MLSFEEFSLNSQAEEAGVEYIVIEMDPNESTYAELSTLTEGQWKPSALRGWMIRVDPARPEMRQLRHVHVAQDKHVTVKTQQVAWNDNGTRHDRQTFNPKTGAMHAAKAVARKALALPDNFPLEQIDSTHHTKKLLLESAYPESLDFIVLLRQMSFAHPLPC
jgi:hypothetical protein